MTAGNILNGEEIRGLIETQSLVSGFLDLEKQLTPNGMDFTASTIHAFDGEGAVDFDNSGRVLPGVREVPGGGNSGWWLLKQGAYRVSTNETVRMPLGLIAFAFTRSSLLRCGAFTQTGVWDAGFHGRSEFILVVQNPAGIRIRRNARLIQLVFAGINPAGKGYDGIYRQKV